jgi:hypothetical protein
MSEIRARHTVTVSTRVPQALSDAINVARGSQSRSSWLERAIRDALERQVHQPSEGPPILGHFWGPNAIARIVKSGIAYERYRCTQCGAISNWFTPSQRLPNCAAKHTEQVTA